MTKKTLNKLLISLSITISLAVLALISVRSRVYQSLELKALDLRFSLRPASRSIAPILHVDIDDQSLAELGRWPWPRIYHEKLTSILKELGAKQVLMDVIFTEEYTDNPNQDILFSEALASTGITYLPFYFLENKDITFDPLRAMLAKDITISLNDAAKYFSLNPKALNERFLSIKRSILDSAAIDSIKKDPESSLEDILEDIEESQKWFLFSEDEKYLEERITKYKTIVLLFNKFHLNIPINSWPFKKECLDINPPIKLFTEHIKGSGFLNSDADIDGITRKVPLFIKYQNSILPHLTLSALIDLLLVEEIKLSHSTVILKNAHLNNKVKDIVIPVDENSNILINWRGKWGKAFDHISYSYILKLQEIRDQLNLDLTSSDVQNENAGVIDYLKKSEAELVKKVRDLVKGKTCIVGLTATGTHDLRAVPIQTEYPMVGVHSNLFETILNEKFIVHYKGFVRIFIFLFTACVIAFGSIMKLWKSFLLWFGYFLLYFFVAFFLFVKFGIWIDLVGPFGIVFFGSSAITSFRFFTEEKEKLWIKKAFSHYLSDEVISEMINDPSRLNLGGKKRNITVLFSDIRGFTSYSEGHQPEEVVAMLNEILTEQVKVVFKYNGTLDKFVGDELMAFWGAPSNKNLNDHALLAVKTSIEIQAKMRELQQKWSDENKDILHIGIGINSGDMIVGNMGSAERMDYTVIGDNVNLGARLCSVAGKSEIIISESTYEMSKEHINVENLEPVYVKGKVKPISIYKVIGLK
ncbi:MAG: adenylate/guanylate cyclase domain-containing protein [Candidatus Omnitrophica bacterium]|nr:adenylate/guanylate cyclase domain-containing protein [Candidatus Omnitrophota bacterium]MBU1995603.1 adenylate/guanylate cyclase domain-containing protein [Candidatus Omnitrophota bacterium]MBU4334201.1 adenylate/guanylate cyclase domain-containing protein [Candidatus Omnitrophota bacterium]